MRKIETTVMISLKRIIEQYPLNAKNLLREGDTLEDDISTFASLAGLHPVFVRQNLQQIRNWIE